MKKFLPLLILPFLLLFCACSQEDSQTKKPLIISTNAWIGYAPLFYAYEKKQLQKIGISIFTSVSLAEATDLFRIGKADIVTTTQHECSTLKNEGFNIVPIILLDRSNGGDMILSNKSIVQLQNSKKIVAYLEIDSINTELLQDFIKKYGIKKEQLILKNMDQAQIQDIAYDSESAILIVTYTPYDIKLKKEGYKELASTRNIQDLMVIDALCISKTKIDKNRKRLIALKEVIDFSIESIMKDPKASYKLVKKYLNNIEYNEYLEALKTIKWINKPSKELLNRIEKIGYKEEYLIQ
jgi:NitT/TauT family transport system substrate-binding protein